MTLGSIFCQGKQVPKENFLSFKVSTWMLFCMLLCCSFSLNHLFAGWYDDNGIYHPSPGEMSGMGTGMAPYQHSPGFSSQIADDFNETARLDRSIYAPSYHQQAFDPSLDYKPVVEPSYGQQAIAPYNPRHQFAQQQLVDFSQSMPMQPGYVTPQQQYGQMVDPMSPGFQQPAAPGFGEDIMYQRQRNFMPALREAQIQAALARNDVVGARAIQLAQAQDKEEAKRQRKAFAKLAEIQRRGQQEYAPQYSPFQPALTTALVPYQSSPSFDPSYPSSSLQAQQYDSVHHNLFDVVGQGNQEHIASLEERLALQNQRIKKLAAKKASLKQSKGMVDVIAAERAKLQAQLIAQKARNEEMRAAAIKHDADLRAIIQKQASQQAQGQLVSYSAQAQPRTPSLLTTAVQAKVTEGIAAALANPNSTEDDFNKLLMPTTKPDGTHQEPLVSMSALHTYLQSAATTYAQHKQHLDDLEERGASEEEIAQAQQEVDQITKLRTVLEKRRKYELANIRDSKKEFSKPSSMQGDPNDVLATVHTAKGMTSYTREMAAQDRLEALGREKQHLKAAKSLTTELDAQTVEEEAGRLFTGAVPRTKLNNQTPGFPLLQDTPVHPGAISVYHGSSTVPLLTNEEEDSGQSQASESSPLDHLAPAERDELIKTYFPGGKIPTPPKKPQTPAELSRWEALKAAVSMPPKVKEPFTRKDPRETTKELLARKVKESYKGPLPTKHQIAAAQAAHPKPAPAKRVGFAAGTKQHDGKKARK